MKNESQCSATPDIRIGTTTRLAGADKSKLNPGSDRLESLIKMSQSDLAFGRHRLLLYRFLTENIPAISACIWTWSRLSAAPGEFRLKDKSDSKASEGALKRLRDLSKNGYANIFGNRLGLSSLRNDLFRSLYCDGRFSGFVIVKPDHSGVDRFMPVDSINLEADQHENDIKLFLNLDDNRIDLNRPDFYHCPLGSGVNDMLGTSILRAIPFIAYIEQQLVDDMRRSSHNSGYHRLHVKVTPPERMSGESDNAYTDRINSYFDSTVRMVGNCDVDENPVTWDNIEITYVGPDKSRAMSNSWFVNHRSMIEEICAGTNLAPFLLGYSYGATTTWSAFKFDIVMRQIRTIQAQMSNFMEWLGNIELALGGYDTECEFVFDNSFAYQASDVLNVQSGKIDNLLKLYDAGLIDKATADEQARGLI